MFKLKSKINAVTQKCLEKNKSVKDKFITLVDKTQEYKSLTLDSGSNESGQHMASQRTIYSSAEFINSSSSESLQSQISIDAGKLSGCSINTNDVIDIDFESLIDLKVSDDPFIDVTDMHVEKEEIVNWRYAQLIRGKENTALPYSSDREEKIKDFYDKAIQFRNG
jgi:hypothetical protein